MPKRVRGPRCAPLGAEMMGMGGWPPAPPEDGSHRVGFPVEAGRPPALPAMPAQLRPDLRDCLQITHRQPSRWACAPVDRTIHYISRHELHILA